MAVTTQESTQYANTYTTRPVVMNNTTDVHGRMRIAYFEHTQSGAGDATSSVAVAKLPPGRVRLLGALSNVYVNWTTASATMDAGWDAYTELDGTAVVADPNGLDDGIDVDAAGATALGSVLASAASSKVFESKEGVTIRLTSQDVALAASSAVAGYIVYVQD
jgi:hypothetical protein